MSRLTNSVEDLLGLEDEPTEEIPLFTTVRFKLHQRSANHEWALIERLSMGDTRWVPISDIRNNGVDVAFYDADPTYKPGDDSLVKTTPKKTARRRVRRRRP